MGSAPIFAQKLDRSVRPKAGAAPIINISDPATFTLDNGLKVFVVENHKLPRTTLTIQFDIDPDPEGDKVGARSFVGSLITSGTKSRPKDVFDEETDKIGAQIRASSTGLYGQSLSKHQDKMMELLSDALLNANFQQKELTKLKKRAEANLISSLNEPDAMLNNVTSVLNYGKDHVYGEVMTEESLAKINLGDCIKYYRTYMKPNVAYMAVVGDITVEKAKELVTKHFGKWEKGVVARTQYPPVPKVDKTTVNFVQRAGAVQSVIGITYPIDLQIGTPDVFKTRVLNEILGGSSQGRLFLNLREDKAWTYGSYSTIASDNVIGHVQLYVKCRNAVTDSSLTEMISEMNKLRNTPVSQEELEGAINFISGKTAIGLESPSTLAQYAISIERYGLPKDYYRNYIKNINAVTAADVQNAAQKYITPNKANIVVVGNKSELEKIRKFDPTGEVKFYDNYGNEIAPIEDKVIDGVGVAQILEKYINAIGGRSAIESINDISTSGTVKRGGVDILYSTYIVSPTKYANNISFNGEPIYRTVVSNDKGFREQGKRKFDMSEDDVMFEKSKADVQSILNPDKYGISYQLLDVEVKDGKKTYHVEKIGNNGRNKAVQYYDAQTGLLVKEIYTENFGGTTSSYINVFSNYKEVKNGNGYKIPFKIAVTGADVYQIDIRNASANSGKVKDKHFE